ICIACQAFQRLAWRDIRILKDGTHACRCGHAAVQPCDSGGRLAWQDSQKVRQEGSASATGKQPWRLQHLKYLCGTCRWTLRIDWCVDASGFEDAEDCDDSVSRFWQHQDDALTLFAPDAP